MENLMVQAKDKLNEIIFRRKSLDKILKEKYKNDKNEFGILFLMSFLTFLFSVMILCFIDEKSIWLNALTESLLFGGSIGCMISMPVFIIYSIIGLFLVMINKNTEKNIKQVKIEKFKNTVLTLEQLKEFKPLLNKLRVKIPKRHVIASLKKAEEKTGEKFGNAYHLLYLFENYKNIITEIEKEENYTELLNKTVFGV